jgi:hypothetical protein
MAPTCSTPGPSSAPRLLTAPTMVSTCLTAHTHTGILALTHTCSHTYLLSHIFTLTLFSLMCRDCSFGRLPNAPSLFIKSRSCFLSPPPLSFHAFPLTSSLLFPLSTPLCLPQACTTTRACTFSRPKCCSRFSLISHIIRPMLAALVSASQTARDGDTHEGDHADPW